MVLLASFYMEHVFIHTPLWKQLVVCLTTIERIAESSGTDVDGISVPYTSLAVNGLYHRQQLRALGKARKEVFRRSTWDS